MNIAFLPKWNDPTLRREIELRCRQLWAEVLASYLEDARLGALARGGAQGSAAQEDLMGDQHQLAGMCGWLGLEPEVVAWRLLDDITRPVRTR